MRRTTPLVAALILMAVAVMVLGAWTHKASAAQRPCIPGQICSEVPLGPALVSDGTAEANEALAAVRADLMQHHVQLTYRVTVNGDGTTRPEIVVQTLWPHDKSTE